MASSSRCSDEIDPDYAHFLATYNPAEFEEGHTKCHPEFDGLIEEQFNEHKLKSQSWQLTISESMVNSKSVLVIPKAIENACLYPSQKYIKLIDEDIGFSCICEIDEADEDCSEIYIGGGWHDYVEVKDLAIGWTWILGGTCCPDWASYNF